MIMRKVSLMLLLAGVQLSLFATKVTITAGGNPMQGIAAYYSPANVTINVGDTVEWKNVQGSHNVDGRQSSYPSNPASFYSGSPASGWTFTYVFTIPGYYQFKCTQGQHATTQHGSVTVLSTTGTDMTPDADLSLFPNPASSLLYLRVTESLHHGMLVLRDLTGREVLRTELRHDLMQQVDVSQLPNGLYVASLTEHGAEILSRRLVIAR